MLEKLLAYHQTLSDRGFIDAFNQRLNVELKRRYWILTLCGVAALVCAILGVSALVQWAPSLTFLGEMSTPLTWSVIGLVVMTFLMWLLMLEEFA